MGSFNTTTCISNLPIRLGDRIMVFLLKRRQGNDQDMACYPTDRYTPLFVPFEAKYYDYGRPDEVKDGREVKAIEQIFGVDIETIIEIFTERIDRRDYTLLGSLDELHNRIFNRISLEPIEDWLDSISLGYEHYDMYEYYGKDTLNDDNICTYFPRHKETNVMAKYLEILFGLKYDKDSNLFYLENSPLKLEVCENGFNFHMEGVDLTSFSGGYHYVKDLGRKWNVVAEKYNLDTIQQKCGIKRACIQICREFTMNELNYVHNSEYRLVGSYKEEDGIKDKFISYYPSIYVDIFKPYIIGSNLSCYALRTNELLLDGELEDSLCKYTECIQSMGRLNLFFKLSDYANQDIDYAKLAECEEFRMKFIQEKYDEYKDEYEEECEEYEW